VCGESAVNADSFSMRRHVGSCVTDSDTDFAVNLDSSTLLFLLFNLLAVWDLCRATTLPPPPLPSPWSGVSMSTSEVILSGDAGGRRGRSGSDQEEGGRRDRNGPPSAQPPDAFFRAPSLDSLHSTSTLARDGHAGVEGLGQEEAGDMLPSPKEALPAPENDASRWDALSREGQNPFDRDRWERERERIREEEARRAQLFVVQTSLWAHDERSLQVRPLGV